MEKAEDIKTHQVSYGHIIADGEILDEVILIIMKAPNTYTREDVVGNSLPWWLVNS